MVFTESDLEERLAAIRQQGTDILKAYDIEFEEHYSWLKSVLAGLKDGSINAQGVLVPKTPGKQKTPLTAISESFETSIELEEVRPTRSSTQNKRASRKGQTKKATAKSVKVPIVEEEEDVEIIVPTKPLKRLSEETLDSTSKRLCGNRTSETTSRDSGLSSVGSRHTLGRSLGVVKQEVLTPKNTSLESTTKNVEDHLLCVGQNSSADSSRDQSPERSAVATDPSKKRSRSTGREDTTFVVKEEPRRSSRCQSEPRTPNAKRPSTGKDRTFVCASPCRSSPLLSPIPKKQSNYMKSPIVKAPPHHLLKGESVKKAVKAFEALNEDQETDGQMPAPTMLPPSKIVPPSKTVGPNKSAQSSLDDALNAPTRLTRTKTRAMAKAAAQEDKAGTKEEQSASLASKMLKSPIQQYQQKNMSAMKTMEKRPDDHYEKENSTFSSSRMVLKPFGSASKQPQMFLKSATPLNRIAPVTPSHSSSTSFSAPRVNNLVTSVESFILKPVMNQEVKPSREENLQKLVAKAEVASKKKEEMMKAQLEERIKKRQEKRLKVCAAREAMEKEKMEMQLKLEREREEKQKQILAEREEKIRQEYLKKKRLAQQKAAETEERRRQEEAARLAKLKQQEEEQRRIAAQRKKEQEEAERKQMERIQQEREAAAYRAKEAERLAKEAALKAKNTSKVQLDQTYDKLSPLNPPPQSYGMTPGPEERQPLPLSNPNNYGIDDAGTDDSSEDEAKPKKAVPLWAQSKLRIPKLKEDYEITHRQMFIFFGSKKSTPDLSKIFTAIDRRQLIRKSSAVWRTPPVKH